MVPNEKAKIRRFIVSLGDHIKDTTAPAAVSMEVFASVVGFAKSLEETRQKRRVYKDLNKKARTIGGFSGQLVVEVKGFLVRDF